MLDRNQLRAWVDHFATPESQVLRDHLVSHIIAALPGLLPHATLFGGTGLCRTHLVDWRLSEDIDLLVARPAQAARVIDDRLPSALRREFPGLSLRWMTGATPLVAAAAFGSVACRIQLVVLDSGYDRYPTALTRVRLRYEDLPDSVEMRCPTADGAAAMKLSAWADRAAPRDLCDLYGFVQAGSLTRHALDIVAASARPILRQDFAEAKLPASDAWQTALGHQMRRLPDRRFALESVRAAVTELQEQ